MITFRIISIGKTKAEWVNTGFQHYSKLIAKFAELDDIIVKAEKISDESRAAHALDKEADSILKRLQNDNPLIVLDQNGTLMNSEKLSKKLNSYFNSGTSNIDFVIGSAHGLSEKIKQKADLVFSLSPMTFPHEITKLLLAEQLYRAMSILHNTKYHK